MVTPVLQQARGFRGDTPVVGVGKSPPLVDFSAQGVHEGGVVVFLLFGRNPQSLTEGHSDLLPTALAFLRLGDRGDELSPAALSDDLLGRLAGVVQLPMAVRVLIGRIENRVLSLIHISEPTRRT